MMILLTLLLNIVAFIHLHNQTKFIDKYPNGWRQITSYCIGVLLTLPFFAIYDHELQKQKYTTIAAYLLAFVGSGIGTSIGWMYKDLKNVN